jgi:hypothetical protein
MKEAAAAAANHCGQFRLASTIDRQPFNCLIGLTINLRNVNTAQSRPAAIAEGVTHRTRIRFPAMQRA